MADDVVPVRYLAVVAPGQGGLGGYGLRVDVTAIGYRVRSHLHAHLQSL